MGKETRKFIVLLTSVFLGCTCLCCIRPVTPIKPVDKISKKKGKI